MIFYTSSNFNINPGKPKFLVGPEFTGICVVNQATGFFLLSVRLYINSFITQKPANFLRFLSDSPLFGLHFHQHVVSKSTCLIEIVFLCCGLSSTWNYCLHQPVCALSSTWASLLLFISSWYVIQRLAVSKF